MGEEETEEESLSILHLSTPSCTETTGTEASPETAQSFWRYFNS